MKHKSLFVLICCIFIGSISVFANNFGDGNRNKVDLKVSSLLSGYCQRQMNIRSHISGIFSGTYLDSMNMAINILCDSVRSELSKAKTKDSAAYYKTCLDNIIQDSLMLDRLSKLSIKKEHISPDFSGALMAHCIDVSNSAALDSVGMDLFSGNRLVASAISDKYGSIHIENISKGYYDIVFSRRLYTPVSLKHIEFSDTKQPNIYIPLKKQNSYLIRVLSENTLLFLVGIVLILLVVIMSLAYLIRFVSNRKEGKSLNK